jgi:hypothetical protein
MVEPDRSTGELLESNTHEAGMNTTLRGCDKLAAAIRGGSTNARAAGWWMIAGARTDLDIALPLRRYWWGITLG